MTSTMITMQPYDRRRVIPQDELLDELTGGALAAALIAVIQATSEAIRRDFACPVCGSIENRMPVDGGGSRCPKCRAIVHAGNRE